MCKFSLLLSIVLTSLTVKAQSLSVVGPCSAEALYHYEKNDFQSQSVGEFTVQTFDLIGINYLGTTRGMNSIEGSVTGMDALEILSKSEMRAYGWCYSINGSVPEEFADSIELTSTKDKVVWFFAFAHYLDGQWVAQCVPANSVKPIKLCAGQSEQ